MQTFNSIRSLPSAVLTNTVEKPFFQPKLTVNTPGDAYEQEADAVADQVMRMPTFVPSAGERQGESPVAQRMPLKPLHGIQRMCSKCAENEEENHGVHRKESGGSDAGGKTAPSIVNEVISSGDGQAMDGGTRQFMESRFGQDFSGVRIHTGSKAAESAGAIQARAYTSGRDVVFGAGEYQPASDSGRRLLAHELAHVGQQGGGMIKRAVNANRVTCANYPRSYPIFTWMGTQDPVTEIEAADERAIELLDNTISELEYIRTQITGGEVPAWPVISDCLGQSLQVRLLMNSSDRNTWIGTGPGTVVHFLRWLRNLRAVFDGGWLRYSCRGADCEQGDGAYMTVGQGYLIHLCNWFWHAPDNDARALVLVHELAHIYYDTIDSGSGPGSSYCIHGFIADINGITASNIFNACNSTQMTAC